MKDLNSILVAKTLEGLLPLLSEKVLQSPQYAALKSAIENMVQFEKTVTTGYHQRRTKILEAVGNLFSEHGLEAIVSDLAPIVIDEAPTSPADEGNVRTTFIQASPETD